MKMKIEGDGLDFSRVRHVVIETIYGEVIPSVYDLPVYYVFCLEESSDLLFMTHDDNLLPVGEFLENKSLDICDTKTYNVNHKQ